MEPARLLRSFALLAIVTTLGGCDRPVPTLGSNISDLFPETADHFWKYDNGGFTEVAYWLNEGPTSPAGEEWTTFRWWVSEDQDFIDDYQDDKNGWSVALFFAERSSGWYFMGWDANPDGPSPQFGTAFFDGDGVPFAMANVHPDWEREVEAGGATWTTRVYGKEGPLEFNGQMYTDVWHIGLSTDVGGFPFEGDYWLKLGPGIVQWDVSGYTSAEELPWQHVHNDIEANILGIAN